MHDFCYLSFWVLMSSITFLVTILLSVEFIKIGNGANVKIRLMNGIVVIF